MVTIKDISKACGVAPSTVSKALNRLDGVGREKAEQIRQMARDMGYHPSAAAQMLKTNRSHNLGLLYVDNMQSGLRHEYFSQLLESFKKTAESLGYDITFISNSIGTADMTYLEHARYRRCDGVLVANVDYTDPEVLNLVMSEIPSVTIDYVFNDHGAILSDNVQGMTELMTCVFRKGHRRIALLHGEDTSVTQRRLAVFYRCCAEFGLAVSEEYIREVRYHDPVSTEQATEELLALPERPTCILFSDDYAYLGGRAAIERAGLSVPDDISVTGYDGIPLSQFLRPRLTTIRQDTDRIGAEAARMLVDSIENMRTYIPHSVTVPVLLIPGETVRDIS